MDRETREDLYKGLQALSNSAFPKKCRSCGRIFESAEEFISQSESLSGHSGLKASEDDDDTPVVELFRNCPCGSTLMDVFNDRRDLSERGLKRREIFGNILTTLEEKGLTGDEAREELLKIMHGGRSDVIEKFGIKMSR